MLSIMALYHVLSTYLGEALSGNSSLGHTDTGNTHLIVTVAKSMPWSWHPLLRCNTMLWTTGLPALKKHEVQGPTVG